MSTHSRRQSVTSGRDTGGRGRHDRHTSQACLGCRQRKIRCDPERPGDGRPCSSCANANKECIWSPVQDGRKPPTAEAHNALRQHNERLQEENEALRRALLQLGVDPAAVLTQPDAGAQQIDTAASMRVPLARRASVPMTTGAQFNLSGGLSSHPDSANPAMLGGYLDVPGMAPIRRQGSNGMDEVYGSAVSDTEDADSAFDSMRAHSPHSYPSSGRSSFSYSSTRSVPPLVTVSPDQYSPTDALVPFHNLVDSGGMTCSCEWDRHLPLAVKAHQPPLTCGEHDELLERYFKYSAPWNLRVIQDYFLEAMRATLSTTGSATRPAHYSGALHNVILAEATSFLPGSWLSQQHAREEFLNQARATAMNGHPIAVIQTYIALSHFYMGFGSTETALEYLNEAVNQAKSAGICTSMREGAADAANRDLSWCFYTSVIQDTQIAVLRQDMPIIPQHPSNIPIVGRFGRNETLSQLFIHSVHLGRIANFVIRSVTNGQTPTPSDIAGFHSQLLTWSTNLPGNLQLTQKKSPDNHHVLVLHIVHRWYIIHLNERFAADNADCRKHVQDAIGKIVKMLAQYSESVQSLSLSPLVLAQATFATGRAALGLCDIPVVARKQRETAATNVTSCIRALHEIAQTWHCAHEYAASLQNDLNARMRQPAAGMQPVPAQGLSPAIMSPISPGAPPAHVWQMTSMDPALFSSMSAHQHTLPLSLDTAGVGQLDGPGMMLPTAMSMEWMTTPSSDGMGDIPDFSAMSDFNTYPAFPHDNAGPWRQNVM
ncbi:hypothetical protein AURDEDRAFT_187603 [Auricularia subglabra TFB-10046 SS5]|nr:hypothetical protein AURDEDRAFT_187603 [Auricularia subglabra TFB-10046 SS5]